MKNVAKLKFCIIGGTAFGKTSIAASLLRIAATTDGTIHLCGSPKELLRAEEVLQNHGRLDTTSWNNIQKFRFRLEAKGGKSWDVSFFDYPGAFFGKFIEDTNLLQKLKEGMGKTQNASAAPAGSDYSFDEETKKKVKKLQKEMEQADGLIVLLPADFGADVYKNDRIIYKQKLAEFIEAVQKRCPNIPVCLAINKWDMFDGCKIEDLPEKLQEKPFADIYHSLRLCCKENLLTAAISAFGHHDPNDKAKLDCTQDQTPLNVFETMLLLAEKAEKARTLRNVQYWKQSNFWQKVFVLPWRSKDWVKQGSNSQQVRSGFAKIFFKTLCWLGLAVVIALIALATVLTVQQCRIAERKIGVLGENLAQYEQPFELLDKSRIEILHRDLTDFNRVQRIFYPKKLHTLEERLTNLEAAYNQKLLAELEKKLGTPDFQIPSPVAAQSEVRKARGERQIDEMRTTVSRLTDDAEIEKINQRIEALQDEMERYDDPVYQKLYALFHAENREEICRNLEQFLKENEKALEPRYVDEVKNLIEKEEQQVAAELNNELAKLDQQLFLIAPLEWEKRYDLYQKEITTIQSYEKRFLAESRRFPDFQEQIQSLEEKMAHEALYGPFDIALAKATKDGTLNAVHQLITDYDLRGEGATKYSERAEAIAKLLTDEEKLLGKITTLLQKTIALHGDSPEKPAASRIADCNARIQAYEKALQQLPSDFEAHTQYEKAKNEDEQLLPRLENYKTFEKAFANLCNDRTQGLLLRIAKFEETYPQKDYPDHAAKFQELITLKKTTLDTIKEQLTANLDLHQDDKTKPAARRIDDCNARIQAYEEALQQLPSDFAEHAQYEANKDKDKQQLRVLETYKTFEEAFEKLYNDRAPGLLLRIAEFEKTYPQKEYPDHTEKFEKLKNLKTETLEALRRRLEQILQEHQDSPDRPVSQRLTDCKERIQAYKTILEQLPVDSEESRHYQEEKQKDEELLPQLQQKDEDEQFSALEAKKPTAADDFTGLADFYRNQKELCDKFKAQYSEDSTRYFDWQKKSQQAEENLQKYANFAMIKHEADTIEEMPIDSESEQKAVLRRYVKFPKEQWSIQPELQNIYESIKQKAQDAETRLCRQLEKELDGWPISGDGAAKARKQQIGIIDNYLSYLVFSYDDYKARRDVLMKQCADADQTALFDEAYDELKGKLEDNSLSSDDKIALIDAFPYSSEQYPQFATRIKELKNRREQYAQKQKWENLDRRVRDLLSKPPSSNDSEKIFAYKRECTALEKQIGEFQSKYGSHPECGEALTKLNDEIRRIESQFGTGSIQDVEDKEKAYRKNPSDYNYSAFQAAVRLFDSDSSRSNVDKEKRDAAYQRVENYHKAAMKFRQFRNNPDNVTWNAFMVSVKAIDSTYPQKYSDFIVKVNAIRSINVKLVGWKFSNTRYYNWGNADCWVWISANSQGLDSDEDAIYYQGIYGGNWDYWDPSYKQNPNRLLDKSIQIFESRQQNTVLTIKFGNFNGWNAISGKIPLDLYTVIGKALESGNCVLWIEDPYLGGGKEAGKVALQFSGLPTLE